ncbi:MAG: allene oxide cyclase barrel-like domain-containing protein [Actinomycetes bacterium]
MRKLMSIGTALILLTTLGLVAVAGQTAANADDNGDRTVIKLTAVAAQEAELDLGEEGFGLGDQFVFSDWLFRHGEQVGRDGGACTITHVDETTFAATAQCIGTLELPKGQITVQGLVTFTEEDPPFWVAVTGGTGAYKTAKGQMKITPVDEHTDRYRVVLVH